MSERFYEALGARIKARREEIHLRQAEVAESVGLSRTSITNIERGRQRLFLDQFVEICRALETLPAEMIPESMDLNVNRPITPSSPKRPPSVERFLESVDMGNEVSE